MLDIKKEREKLKMTQEEFADLLGVTRKTIVNYEGGSNIPESKEKIFTRILSNYTQPEINHETNDSYPGYKKIEQDKIDFITKALENNFDELMEDKLFKKEFVFRASEWVNNFRK